MLYRYRLWCLQHEKDRLRGIYAKAIKGARKQKKPAPDIDKLRGEEALEVDLVSDQIAALHNRYLIERAETLDIPVPEFTDADDITGISKKWMASEITGRYRLTDAVRHDLRTQIESAEKIGRERLTWWVPIIFGLVSSLIALVSVSQKSHPAPVVVQIVSPATHAGKNSK